ncbi:uncharacterized protein LOC133626985 [Colius striatus]|uniref:uncharacterized protein LOC133626985 n=1 Tax=Colius striatus TaxID=57412 RepID=UPI002B1D0631|nr:uncharacterized protein LOC133626985 [Colius striatus]
MATTQCPEEAPGQDGTECGCQEPSADTSFQTHPCLRRFPQCLPSPWQQPSRPGLSGMEKRPPKVPRIAWEEKKEHPGAAAAWQPNEVEEVQPLQADWNLLEEEQPSNVSSEHVLDKSLSELALGDPHDAVVTLLHRAPLCDREAAAIWRQMVSTSRRPEKVLRELLRVLEDWPLHRTSTSDGDSIHICALAATRALQEISRMPQLPLCFPLFFPRFFRALLFQVFCSMEELPEEVHALWFAMQTLKILLCRLGLEDVVLEAQRKCVWDTLLYPETRHCAMRILAR